MSQCACQTANTRPRALNLKAIHAALQIDDLDRALELGLLDWNECEACAHRQAIPSQAIQLLRTAKNERLNALAARARYRAREHRLQMQAQSRSLHCRQSDATTASPNVLPPAAAAALARAKAKAAGV